MAALTRTTVPAMSATMMMHGAVSRVALVSFSAASIRARAWCSAVTSSSWAARTGSVPAGDQRDRDVDAGVGTVDEAELRASSRPGSPSSICCAAARTTRGLVEHPVEVAADERPGLLAEQAEGGVVGVDDLEPVAAVAAAAACRSATR